MIMPMRQYWLLAVEPEFIHHLALVVAAGGATLFVRHGARGRRHDAWAVGALFGAISVFGMVHAIELSPGLFFDGRSVLLSLCALIYGPTAGLIAGAIAAAARVWVGGSGTPMGVAVIASATLAGLAARHRWPSWSAEPTTGGLALFGLAVHAAMLSCVLALLPTHSLDQVLAVQAQLFVPVMLLFPLATLMLGRILAAVEAQSRLVAELEKTSAESRQLFEANPHPMWVYDLETLAFLDVNAAAIHKYGYTRGDFLAMTIADIRPIEDVPRLRAAVGRVVSGYDEASLWRHRLRDGRIIDVEITSHTLVYQGRRAEIVLALDVSERQRADRALRESEERFRLAMRGARQGFYDLNLRTGDAVVSPEYATMLGHDPENFLETNSAWRDRLHPDDREKVYGVFEDYVAGRVSEYRVEFRQRVADGGWVWTLSLGEIVERDHDGKPLRMIGTHTDITALKMAEERARVQLAALNAAPVAFVITDTHGTIQWANPAFSTLTQYHLDEAVGKNPRDLVKSGKHDGQFYEGLWNKILQGDTWQGIIINRRKDGTEYQEEMTIAPIRDNAFNITQFVAVKRDITERLAAERSLRHAQERLQRAVSAGKVGLWEWDLRTDAATYSDEWCAQLGIDPATLAGTLAEGLDRVHPDDTDMAREMLARPERHFEGTATFECRLRHEDGEYRWMLCNATLQRDDRGAPKRVIGANVEITEIKRLQEEVVQAQKMESIGRLAGGVAHDFNNLLSIIGGYAEIVLDRVGDERIRHDVLQIKQAADRAANLTRQLLAFSRRQVLEPKLIDINQVVTEAEKMLRRLIGEDIEFTVRLDPDLGQVLADPGQIEQVLMNLVVNARDAMPTGGQLSMETGNVLVDESFARRHPGASPGPHVRIAVRDNGLGMDKETLGRIFDPFFTTKERGKGTGLGLAVVYGIVKQSGGCIWVESAPGEGTCFEIHLPRVDRARQVEADAAPDPATGRGDETVLVVEDDEPLRRLVDRVLTGAGYTVITAPDGESAVATIRANGRHVDLLLTDVVMPGSGGRAAAEEILAARPGVRVLYMSGYTDDVLSQHGVLDPGIQLIAKPFTAGQITRRIREVLDAR